MGHGSGWTKPRDPGPSGITFSSWRAGFSTSAPSGQIWALAEATKKPLGEQTGTLYEQARLDRDDGYLATWAADMATRGDHYAAGFFVRQLPLARIALAPFGIDFDKMAFYAEGFNPQYLMGVTCLLPSAWLRPGCPTET